ncbi:hypothetical protein Anapl_17028 [Anas platyrhynchos]|uniref:Uncharacterized protein n=1 Tax=Anas platyrhynchos TaxID=8839 RepID=R0LB20_ANAPL|nr:hypothetical protein Anapl_17028 [Anas platyrhynchos]
MLPNEGVIKRFYYKPNTNIYRNTSNVTGRTEHNVKRLKQKENQGLLGQTDQVQPQCCTDAALACCSAVSPFITTSPTYQDSHLKNLMVENTDLEITPYNLILLTVNKNETTTEREMRVETEEAETRNQRVNKHTSSQCRLVKEQESFVQGDMSKALPQADSRRFILIGHFSTADKIKFLSESNLYPSFSSSSTQFFPTTDKRHRNKKRIHNKIQEKCKRLVTVPWFQHYLETYDNWGQVISALRGANLDRPQAKKKEVTSVFDLADIHKAALLD